MAKSSDGERDAAPPVEGSARDVQQARRALLRSGLLGGVGLVAARLLAPCPEPFDGHPLEQGIRLAGAKVRPVGQVTRAKRFQMEAALGEAMTDLIERFRQHQVRIPDSYIGIARVLITVGGFLMKYDVPFDWTPPERRPTR